MIKLSIGTSALGYRTFFVTVNKYVYNKYVKIVFLNMKIYKEDRIVFRDIVALWAHEGRYNDNEEP